MRLSIVLLCAALAGMLGGGALIGTWALGLCLIADSIAVGVFALLRDADGRVAAPAGVPTLHQILERARAS